MTRHDSSLAEETIAPDEAEVTAEFIAFLEAVSAKRYPTGTIRRFNQPRHAGCVEAEFTVLESVPTEHRVGLFARPATFAAWIRFASATSQSDREKDVRGMSIKVSRVPGENLMSGGSTQDFILNSHPVMMTPGTREFLDLLRAVEAGGMRRALYFLAHPRAAVVAVTARQHPANHLDISYWSTTPYLFGQGRAVKYIARPWSQRTSTRPATLTDTYLHDALKAHLEQADACFDFMIQFQTDSRQMPIEDARVEWKERDSPYHRVARIRIPRQRIDDSERMKACEYVAFNPWNCLVDHRPLGNFNRARKEIYKAMAQFRHERNAAPADSCQRTG
jgi:hypothetical protein